MKPYLEEHWEIEICIFQLLETAVHESFVEIYSEKKLLSKLFIPSLSACLPSTSVSVPGVLLVRIGRAATFLHGISESGGKCLMKLNGSNSSATLL